MATSMFAADSRTGSQALAEMNVTPLVDVMLVLLIIFMVAAPIATGSLDLRLPQRPPPDTAMQKPSHLSLAIRDDGQFTLEGVLLTEPALVAALSEAAKKAPDAIVDVAVSENADYQAFTTALSAARRSGLTNIALQH